MAQRFYLFAKLRLYRTRTQKGTHRRARRHVERAFALGWAGLGWGGLVSSVGRHKNAGSRTGLWQSSGLGSGVWGC